MHGCWFLLIIFFHFRFEVFGLDFFLEHLGNFFVFFLNVWGLGNA